MADVWERPRNLALLVAATAVLASLVFGVLGYDPASADRHPAATAAGEMTP